MKKKLIGQLRPGLAWHYVDSEGKGSCVALSLSGHSKKTELTNIHPRTDERICGACSWED